MFSRSESALKKSYADFLAAKTCIENNDLKAAQDFIRSALEKANDTDLITPLTNGLIVQIKKLEKEIVKKAFKP